LPETVKQLVTLVTAIWALMITFAKDFVGRQNLSSHAKWFLVASRPVYFLSVLFGTYLLRKMAENLDPNPDSDLIVKPSIWDRSVKRFSDLRRWCFVAGLVLTALYGVWSGIR
jgi:hypothetical protein